MPPLEAECGEETLWGFSIDRTLEKPVLSFFFLFLCWVGGEEGGGRGTRMFSQRTLGRPAAGPQRTPGSHSSRPRGGTPWKGGTVRRGLGHAPRPLARLRLRPPTSAPAVQLFFFLLPTQSSSTRWTLRTHDRYTCHRDGSGGDGHDDDDDESEDHGYLTMPPRIRRPLPAT